MNKIILTDCVVSKGFDNNPAVKFSEKSEAAFFTIGKRVYDKNAENNHRYINFDVKAFGELSERIRKMDMKEGSYIHLTGRIDEETWEDKDTKKTRRKTVIILDEIEYTYSGNKDNQNGGGKTGGGQNGNGQNGNGNGYPGAQGGYGNPGMGAMPPQYQQGGQYPQQMPQQFPQQMPQQGQMPQNFTGFENFSGNGNNGNPYFGQG